MRQAHQPPAVSLQLTFDMPEPVRGRRVTVTMNCDNNSLPTPAATTSLRDAGSRSASTFFHAVSTSSSFMPDEEHHVPHNFYNSLSSSSSSLVQDAPAPQWIKKNRYYSHTLSDEDRDSLACGEQNHNLKEFTRKDTVMHHESRKALIPTNISKLDKMDAITHVEKAKQHYQKNLNKKVRDTVKLPLCRLIHEHGKGGCITYSLQASQSMYDLRYSITPAPHMPSVLPVASPLLNLPRKFSFEATPPPLSRSLHVRTTSGGDYFSHPIRPQLSRPPSSPSSGTSSRVRSPLANEFPPHQLNPNATFDAFLVPHKSGKGEVFRGTANAKRSKSSSNTIAAKPDPYDSLEKEKSSTRRIFSRMPSMPSLRKRSSHRDIRKGSVDETDLPVRV
jgi:hypothetical protein